MRATIDFLRAERRARIFFIALTQSALGTGAGYVGLLLLAYERFRSVWSISLVLLADLLPAMLLGPLFGAVADRWSRRGCLILADVIRAAAFAGVALVGGIELTILFALLAGLGTGLFNPAALAVLPNLSSRRHLPAATSLYGAITDVGFTAGPAIAAIALAVTGSEGIMVLNAVTFGISALLLASIAFGASRDPVGPAPWARRWRWGLVGDARAGLSASFGTRPIRIVLLASTAGLLCAGMFNVAELPFVTQELGASGVGFSLLVALFGAGIAVGSLMGARGGGLPTLKRRYLTGLLLMAVSLLGIGLAKVYGTAVVAFLGAGYGNGVMLVHERLLLQNTVPDELLGRVFGTKDALTAWAFALAFLVAPLLIDVLGTRTLLLCAGGVAVVTWIVPAYALRDVWRDAEIQAGTETEGESESEAERVPVAESLRRGA
jgi:MFS family permease